MVTQTPWLELLSNVDKMVVGSIVGSVVLAFILLVVIFSLRTHALHQRIQELNGLLTKRDARLETYRKDAKSHATQIEKSQRKLAQAQQEISELQQALKTARSEHEGFEKRIGELHKRVAQLQEEKKSLANEATKAREDLVAAREEVEAALKRNEFWVDQLSQLRTKYDGLTLKVRRMEQARS